MFCRTRFRLLICLSIFSAIVLLLSSCGRSGGTGAPPVLAIISHVEGAVVTASPVTIEGSIDENRSITSVTVSHNGTDVSEDLTIEFTQISFTFSLTLTDTDNAITVTATNDKGQSGSATVNLTYDPSAAAADDAAPVITFTTHADGQTVNSVVGVLIGGGLADIGRIISLQVLHQQSDVTGTAGLVYSQSDFTFTLTLVEGSNAITVRATDDSGNTGEATLNLINSIITDPGDTVAPTVSINSHEDGEWIIGSDTVSISGTLSDDGTIRTMTVTQNGTDVTSTVVVYYNQTSFSFNLTLAVGNNTIAVSAIDAGGNTGTASIILGFNYTPALSYTSPADGDFFGIGSVGNVHVTGEIYNFTQINSFKVFHDSVDISANGPLNLVYGLNGFDFDLTLTEIVNVIEVQVVGPDAGIYASGTITLNYDGTAPSVSFDSHNEGDVVLGGRSVSINGSLSDNDIIDSIYLSHNGGNDTAQIGPVWDQGSGSFSFTTDLDDRRNTFMFAVIDMAGNMGQTTIHLEYPYMAFANGQAASVVIGQADMTLVVNNSPGGTPNAAGFSTTSGDMAVVNGRLYMADSINDRVLGYNAIPASDGASADFVLGQPTLTDAQTGNADNRMDGPAAVTGDNGNLFVVDKLNHRVLLYNTAPSANDAVADFVIGQTGFGLSASGCSATQLKQPSGAVTVAGKLIVADFMNHRVLIWNAIPTADGAPADLVLGQNGGTPFTTCAINDSDGDSAFDGFASANTMNLPAGVWSDGNRLLVADSGNHRVLLWNIFPTNNGQPADVIIGQANATNVAFNDNTGNGATDGVGPRGLKAPVSALSNGNQIFIADSQNRRVLIFNSFPATGDHYPWADRVLGQSGFYTITGGVSATENNGAIGLLIENGQLILNDGYNYRFLIFNAP